MALWALFNLCCLSVQNFILKRPTQPLFPNTKNCEKEGALYSSSTTSGTTIITHCRKSESSESITYIPTDGRTDTPSYRVAPSQAAGRTRLDEVDAATWLYF